MKDVIKRTGEVLHVDFIIDSTVVTVLIDCVNYIMVYEVHCSCFLEVYVEVLIFKGEMSRCL